MKTTTLPVAIEELRSRAKAARRGPQYAATITALREALGKTDKTLRQAEDEGDGDAVERLNNLWAELQALLEQIVGASDRERAIDEWQRRAEGIPLGATGDQRFDNAARDFSITRAIAARCGIDVDDGREREISAEIVRRAEGRSFAGIPTPLAALSIKASDAPPGLLRTMQRKDVIGSGTPAAGPGGSLIATYLDPSEYIDALRPQMAVRQLGARVISNLSANLNLPRMPRTSDTGWFAENSAILRSDFLHDVVELRPRHCGAILEVSRNMLQQSSPDIESIARNDLAAVLARRVDLAAISGAGGPIEPLGITTDDDVPRLPPAPISYDALVDLSSLLANANALEGSLGWLTAATVRGWLLKLKDEMLRPYGLDLLLQGFPYQFSNLAGGPTAAPNPVIFGNWNDLVIGMWSELDLLVNPYADEAFSKGNVLVRGAMTIDVVKRHVESFGFMSVTAPLPPGNGAQVSPAAPPRPHPQARTRETVPA